MKVKFELVGNFHEPDCNIKWGLSWFKHHKKIPGGGFTIHIILLTHIFCIDFYRDYKKYDKYMSDRHTKVMLMLEKMNSRKPKDSE